MIPARLILNTLFLLSTIASGAVAQERTRTPAEMGTIAADRQPMASFFFLGMLGGTGIGVTGAHYVAAENGYETPSSYAVGGLAIVMGTGIAIEVVGANPPDPHLDAPGTAAYRQAYRDRISSRRRNALALGSLAGIATGVVLFTLLPGLQQ